MRKGMAKLFPGSFCHNASGRATTIDCDRFWNELMERRKQQRRKGPTRVGGDRRVGRAHGGPERRVADRRSGLDRRKFDIVVDYQVRSIPILRCSGRITIGDTARDFSAKCWEMFQRGRPTFALDLSGINHIDSTGIGALASLLTSVRTRGGDLKLISPSRKV